MGLSDPQCVLDDDPGTGGNSWHRLSVRPSVTLEICACNSAIFLVFCLSFLDILIYCNLVYVYYFYFIFISVHLSVTLIICVETTFRNSDREMLNICGTTADFVRLSVHPSVTLAICAIFLILFSACFPGENLRDWCPLRSAKFHFDRRPLSKHNNLPENVV